MLRKSENVPPNLAGEWLRAILTGTPYPLTLLATLLMRLRADKDVNALRVGMLKVRSHPQFQQGGSRVARPRKQGPGLSARPAVRRLRTCPDRPRSAARSTRPIRDKFYGSASAQPRKVFALLEHGSANHLSKVGKARPAARSISRSSRRDHRPDEPGRRSVSRRARRRAAGPVRRWLLPPAQRFLRRQTAKTRRAAEDKPE